MTAADRPDFAGALSLAIDVVKQAGSAFTGEVERTIVHDLQRDVKVEADARLHEFIGRSLRERAPYPVWCEEDGDLRGRLADDQYSWVVDPMDGSVNFSRGIPLCCISVALCRGTEPVLGVVYDFNRAELFSGGLGMGAWLNGRPTKVSEVSRKADAILCTGFPVASDFSSGALMEFVHEVQTYKKVRLLGSAALSLAYVATGRADAYQENGIALWDVAAGLALVKAGGGVGDMRATSVESRFDVKAGNPFLLGNASSPAIERALP